MTDLSRLVRPLAWHEGDEPDEWKSGPYDVWCELGRYQLYYWSIVLGEPHDSADEAKAAAFAHHAPKTLHALDVDAVAALVEAGWNAARKSVYALCEDIEDKAHNDLKDALTDHQLGFYRAEKLTAKRIRKAMGSFEAGDDDNARTALARIKGAAK